MMRVVPEFLLVYSKEINEATYPSRLVPSALHLDRGGGRVRMKGVSV